MRQMSSECTLYSSLETSSSLSTLYFWDCVANQSFYSHLSLLHSIIESSDGKTSWESMDGICPTSVYVSKVKGWGQTFPLMWDLQWNVWLGDSTGRSLRKKEGQFDYFSSAGFNRTYRICTILSYC